MMRQSIAVALAFLATSGLPTSGSSGSTEVRALWVTRTTLTSPASVARMVTAAQSSGLNTLIVQVRGRGDAYYRSTLEPRPVELSASRHRTARAR